MLPRSFTFCRVTVGALKTSPTQVEYIVRDEAVRRPVLDGRELRLKAFRESVSLRHVPDYVVDGAASVADLRHRLRDWAEAEELSEITRCTAADGREVRSHYRAKISFAVGERPTAQQIRRMVDEWLGETFPACPSIAAIHWNTGNIHVHIWLNARQIDGLKWDLPPAEWKQLDEHWNRIYCREMGHDPEAHLARKAETALRKSQAVRKRAEAAADGLRVSWRFAFERVDAAWTAEGRYWDRWAQYRDVPLDPIATEIARLAVQVGVTRAQELKIRQSSLELHRVDRLLKDLEAEAQCATAQVRIGILMQRIEKEVPLQLQAKRLADWEHAGAADIVDELCRRLRARDPWTLGTVVTTPLPERVKLEPSELEVATLVVRKAECAAILEHARTLASRGVELTTVLERQGLARAIDQELGHCYRHVGRAREAFEGLVQRGGLSMAVQEVQTDPSCLGALKPDPQPENWFAAALHRLRPPTFAVADRVARRLAPRLAEWVEMEQERNHARVVAEQLNTWANALPRPETIAARVNELPEESRQRLLKYLELHRQWPPAREVLDEIKRLMERAGRGKGKDLEGPGGPAGGMGGYSR